MASAGLGSEWIDHYAVLTAARHDYLGFYERELASRSKSHYPPFTRLVRLVFAAENDEAARGEARRFRAILGDMGVAEKEGELCYLGPAEAPLKKLRGKHRYSMLLKGPDDAVVAVAREALERLQPVGEVTVTADVDPTDMM